jgi:hypothetical protein
VGIYRVFLILYIITFSNFGSLILTIITGNIYIKVIFGYVCLINSLINFQSLFPHVGGIKTANRRKFFARGSGGDSMHHVQLLKFDKPVNKKITIKKATPVLSKPRPTTSAP